MDSGHTREDANAPSYDSSDEWEIGLGNLIIDLDADLEKDGHHDGAATHLDASPMKVGKMKIKRKVSSSATKGEGVSPITVRKDSNASTGSSTPEDPSSAYSSPDRSSRPEEKGGKPLKSATTGGPSGSNSSVHKRDMNPSVKHDKLVSSIGIKPMGSNILQMKSSAANTLNVSPAPHPSQPAPTRPNTLSQGDGKQQKPCKNPDEGEGEEPAGKKMKMEKDGKGDGKRSGEPGSGGRKHGGKKTKGEKPLRQSVAVDTMDIGVATEPECIGPCEPGTSVNLEGIVWHETDQGVLVVNVTWRNKTYVGTLMDCTRHDWAAPRFCDSPTSDMESRNKGSGRPKRGRNNTSSSNDLSNYTETRSSIHSKLRNSAKGRRGSNASNGTRTPPCSIEKNSGKRKTKESEVEESTQTNKRQKTGVRPNAISEGRNTPVLIECPQPNCNKKYKHKNGLHYHLSHAHHNNLDKDGNWRERNDDIEEDSKSNASDEVGTPSLPTKDKKKDAKDKKDSSKEEESMELDKPPEASVDGSSSHLLPDSGLEASTDSSGESTNPKKSDCSKSREITKSPKAHKTHVDKFTAGMKCLGIPKPKESKASPSKAPKSDAAVDKTGKTIRKTPSSSSDKDMSIFDFNSTSELDEHVTTAEANCGASIEKHVNVSVIRPTPESTHIKSEPVSPTSFAKGSDNAKGPKQHSGGGGSCDHGTDDKSAKKSEKDKSKSDKHKKVKHDKVLMKTGKTIRPIAPAPPPVVAAPAPAPPPQLVAIPTNLVQNTAAVTCALNVPGITTVASKPQAPVVSTSLKPIQPKPVSATPIPPTDIAGSPLSKEKDKKSKPKKKVKGDKERDREKDRLPGSPSESSKTNKELSGEQRSKNPLIPCVPETNILKQALTASGIVEPENNERNRSVCGEIWKRDGNKNETHVDRGPEAPSSSQNKPVSTVSVSNVVMPQIPKLIPTSSVTGQSSRAPKQPSIPMQHPQHPQHPLQPQPSSHHQQQPLALTTGVKACVTKHDAITQERASSNLSVHTSLSKDGPKNTQLLSPPSGSRTGNISPAYSDISEDGVDEHSKQVKPSETFAFDSTVHIKQHGETSRKENDSIPDSERIPVFHNSDRRGAPEGPGSGTVVQGKTPHERDEGRKGDGIDPGSHRPATSTPSQPPSMPHVYSGGHYPYLHGYVNTEPPYHMRLMATDPQYRQQQERLWEEQRKRAEKLREQEGSDKTNESRTEGSEKRRPIVNLQTEPITPPQVPRHQEGKDRSREKEHITKSRHLDFQKKEGGSPSTSRMHEGDKQNGAILLAERQREEVRQYYLYQQKLMEHRQAEEQRRNLEQENRKKEGGDLPKLDSKSSGHVDKSRTPTPTPRMVSTPSKESVSISGDADKRESISPLTKGQKGDSKNPEQRKLIEGYPFLQPPYPYGAIPYDPSHPHFQPMVFLHPDLRYPPTSPAISPAWKSSGEKGRFEQERDRGPSPHSLSSKGGKSPESHDSTTRPLDVLQQHTNQYFSPQQKHGSSSRPRTPDKGHPPPGQRSRSSSPVSRKTPDMSSSSSSSSSTSTSTMSSNREEGRRPTVHQHMHTHQHTHLGMGFPVLPSYDPYVLATQQAAAAAAASASAAAVNPYSVRRDKS